MRASPCRALAEKGSFLGLADFFSKPFFMHLNIQSSPNKNL